MMTLLPNPFVGPRTFAEKDKGYFFGRNREARDLTARIVSERLLLFYAQSGAGKSSLINTRIIPRLRDEEFFNVLPVGRVSGELPDGVANVENIFSFNLMASLVQREVDPLQLANVPLCSFLTKFAKEEITHDQGQPVPHWVYKPDCDLPHIDQETTYSLNNKRMVLFIDQFEEILISHQDRWKEREEFFVQLNEALMDSNLSNLWVVLILREDYVASLDSYAPHLFNRLRARFYMERMSIESALEAVCGPAKKSGHPFAPGVAEKLCEDLSMIPIPGRNEYLEGPYVEPVQLQVVCKELWETLQTEKWRSSANGEDNITLEDLEKAGDVRTALRRFYEDSLLNVPIEIVDEPQLRSWFEQELITAAGTRGLVFRGIEKTGSMPNAAVDILRESFLVRRYKRSEGIWIELGHDCFVGPILESNREWRQEQPLLRFAQEWEDSGRSDEALLEGPTLERLLKTNWQALGPLVDEFVQVCKEQERNREVEETRKRADTAEAKAKQRQQIALVGLVIALIFFILLGITSLSLWIAYRSNLGFEARYLAERSEESSDRIQAIKLAYQAAKKTSLFSTELPSDVRSKVNVALFAALETEQQIGTQPVAVVLQMHEDNVNIATFSPTSNYILTASDDNTARLWDLEGKQIAVLEGHTDWVTSAAFSPSGQRIVTASNDNTARLWDLKGNELRALKGHTDWVTSAAFSPTGQRIVTTSADGTARLWDFDGKMLAMLVGHTDRVNSAAFSSDGERIVTAGADNTARLWDLKGDELATFIGHKNWVNTATFNPDDDRVVTAGEDGTARLWDLEGKELAVLDEHTDWVNSAAFSPNGQMIVTARNDNTARLWDLEGKELAVLEGHTDNVNTAVFNPDSNRVVTASNDGTSRVWDLDGTELLALKGHTDWVNTAVFSRDGKQVVTSSYDQTAWLWDVADSDLGVVMEDHNDKVNLAVFSPDGKLIVTASDDGTARLWNLKGIVLQVLKGHTNFVNTAAFSPDGRLIVTASNDNTARLWDLKGNELKTLEGHTDIVNMAAFSPDGKLIVTASDDKTARLWDLKGNELRALKGHAARVNSAAFSPDGIHLVTASDDYTARLWDVQGNEITVLGDKGIPPEEWVRVNMAAFSPDGMRIITASVDGTARLWDRDGQKLALLQGHDDEVIMAAFDPDGELIVTTSKDGTGRLWDKEGNELIVLEGHVNTAAFSPDGERILTGGNDHTARLWSREGESLGILQGHTERISSVGFSPELSSINKSIKMLRGEPNKSLIVTTSEDGTAWLWPDRDLETLQKEAKDFLTDSLSFEECMEIFLKEECKSESSG